MDATQVLVGANGNVYVGAITATAPDDVATPLGGDWTNLGYISEDGATFTEGKDITDINAWQSFYPVRRVVTGRTVTVSFTLREWSLETIEFALGGTVTTEGDEYIFTPPAPDELDERAIVLEWTDGDKKYRLYVPRGIVSENVETNLTRSGAADLPITFAATDPGADGSGNPLPAYVLFTNDPSFGSGS